MDYLKKLSSIKTLDDAQKRKFGEQARLIFVAAIWIGLFVLMFAYSAKHQNDLPLPSEPRIPTGAAKFF